MNTKMSKSLVLKNNRSGSEQVKSFKAIIQESIYPDNPEYFSSGGMAIAVRTFDAYKKSNPNQDGLIDLMLFFVECGSQFTLDYGDMDEDFYTALEDVFEEILQLIKGSDATVLERYRTRLYAIEEEARDTGWGYGDQIQDLLDMHFPGFLKNKHTYTTSFE